MTEHYELGEGRPRIPVASHAKGPNQLGCGCNWGTGMFSFCHLHAAAPDLLAALMNLHRVANQVAGNKPMIIEQLTVAHAAIAKATE